MDRRRFLAAGGLVAASPLLAGAAGAASAGPVDIAAADARIDFASDGLGLDAREYAAQLQEAVAADGFAADYYSLGGAVEALEAKFARLLGKPAAMFVPTGTLANHLAVRTLARGDRRVLVQAESHLYNDTGDCAETLSGLNLVPLAAGQATVTLAEVQSWVERTAAGRVAMKVGVLAIENPVRRRDHAMVDVAELERVCAYARAQGIRLHLDGARLFTLPLHSGRGVLAHAALFDSVYVSLWKHFNGASGAILAGDAALIDGLYHQRRMFGGSLPHAWPQVALVDRYVDTFEAQYASAWRAADELIGRLRASGRFTARKVDNGTSRFFLAVPGVDPEAFSGRAAARGIVLPGPHAGSTELPMQVNPTLLRRPVAAIAQALVDALA
jgi:threonine aldolase